MSSKGNRKTSKQKASKTKQGNNIKVQKNSSCFFYFILLSCFAGYLLVDICDTVCLISKTLQLNQ